MFCFFYSTFKEKFVRDSTDWADFYKLETAEAPAPEFSVLCMPGLRYAIDIFVPPAPRSSSFPLFAPMTTIQLPYDPSKHKQNPCPTSKTDANQKYTEDIRNRAAGAKPFDPCNRRAESKLGKMFSNGKWDQKTYQEICVSKLTK